jgi:hypothetical protein
VKRSLFARSLAGASIVAALACARCASFQDAAPTDDGGVIDGGGDAGNAGNAGETGNAGDAADAGAAFRCTPDAQLLCEDFEESIERWGLVPTGSMVTTGDGRPGKFFRATVEAGGPDQNGISMFLDTSAALEVRFAFRLARVAYPSDAGGTNNFFPVWFTNGAANASFVVGPGQDAGSISGGLYDVGTTGYFPTPGRDFAWDRWHDARIEIEIGAASRLRVEVDGQVVGEANAVLPAAKMTLHIGIWRPNQPTPALTVELDDVIVTPLTSD